RVEVGQAARDRARRGRGLEHGQEIRSQAGHSREEKTKDNDPDTWHVNLRPSSRATLERSRKPVPPVGCALHTRWGRWSSWSAAGRLALGREHLARQPRVDG